MILCSFVSDDFGIGVIIPIIKDRLRDTSDVTNYRGITLSAVISKLFEYCAMEKYYEFFPISDLQFGFIEKLGCSRAMFALYMNLYSSVMTAAQAHTHMHIVKNIYQLRQLR